MIVSDEYRKEVVETYFNFPCVLRSSMKEKIS